MSGNVALGHGKRRAEDDFVKSSSLQKSHKSLENIEHVHSSIRLLSIQQTPPRNNLDTVSLSSLIGQADLEYMVQINYMVNVDFIMSHLHPLATQQSTFRTTILYQSIGKDEDRQLKTDTQKKHPRVKLIPVWTAAFGTHHTKAMLLFFRDDTVQLVIHTANMIEQDWRNKTQGAFTTGRLPKKLSNNAKSKDPSVFEEDLLDYFSRYQESFDIPRRIMEYDFSQVKAILIGSVPGSHTGKDKDRFGHLRVRAILRQQVDIPVSCLNQSEVICQFSSIGALGKEPSAWLHGEFSESLWASRSGNSPQESKGRKGLKLVFPTVTNVRESLEGWSMGGSLPYHDKNHQTQGHYLTPLCHSWKATYAGRHRAMPHIKTYTRVSHHSSGDYMAWFMLTSANLSKAAWGSITKKGALSIRSFELGVVVFPSLFQDDENQSVAMMNSTLDNPRPTPLDFATGASSDHHHHHDEQESDTVTKLVVSVRLPYDLPLSPYQPRDQPWRADVAFPGQDDFGLSLAL